MVHGEFSLVERFPYAQSLDQASVMTAYDGGMTGNSSRAWKDGLQRGGCNSKWEG
jgi:hypothetical protein